MADVKWIKITTDIFDDEKMLLIESLPEADSIIVIWFKLLCLAGKMNNSGVFMMNDRLAYTDKMLATIFRRKEATVQMALRTFEQFGMVEIIDGVITIPNWGKHQSLEQIEARKEYQRQYQREYRKKQKLLAGSEVEGMEDDHKHSRKHLREQNVNSPEEEREREEERDEERDINIVQKPSKTEIDRFFDSLWSLYPVKKGKGQISEAKKKALYEIGEAEMHRAVHRYLTELKKDAWRKPQNGSTFFNSGYVDYLDANFEPQEVQPVQQNKTATMLDESYDMMDAWAKATEGMS